VAQLSRYRQQIPFAPLIEVPSTTAPKQPTQTIRPSNHPTIHSCQTLAPLLLFLSMIICNHLATNKKNKKKGKTK